MKTTDKKSRPDKNGLYLCILTHFFVDRKIPNIPKVTTEIRSLNDLSDYMNQQFPISMTIDDGRLDIIASSLHKTNLSVDETNIVRRTLLERFQTEICMHINEVMEEEIKKVILNRR